MKSIMNFIIKIWELLKSDPRISISKYLIGTGLILVVGFGSFSYQFREHIVSYTDEADLFGYLFLLVGFVLIIMRYFTITNNPSSLAYGIGMDNMDKHSPLKAIPKYEQFDCIQINLKEIDSYDKDQVVKNYNFNKELLSDRTLNKNSQKVYVGVLGSFPYLFLIGSLFRNAYSTMILLDYDRHSNGGSKWYKLPPFNEKEEEITHQLMYQDISIQEKIEELSDKDSDEVGIALSYTFTVNKNAIPEKLQNNTLYLQHSYGIGHDKLSNEEVQKELLKKLSTYISLLWNNHKKVHLFVSAQSSICINIGKIYMNNAHGTLVLHNYDNDSKTYNWNIEFNKGFIE